MKFKLMFSLMLVAVLGVMPQKSFAVKYTLKKNSIISCEIVVPPEAGPVAAFAGKELQQILSKALGAKVPLLNKPGGASVALVLGGNSLLKQAGIKLAALPRDAFVIRSSGNMIFIAGNDAMNISMKRALKDGLWGQMFERATLFGVYAFLERFAGVRFYFPGEIGTVIPKYKTLELPAINLTIKPDYVERRISAYHGELPGGARGRASFPFKNHNYYRLRMQTRYKPACHGLSRLGYLRRFGKSHPEYFALMSNGKRHNNPLLPHVGQLCFSSGIREEIYRDAVSYLSGEPSKKRGVLSASGHPCWDPSSFQPGYFDIMPQDAFYKCHCPKCKKIFSKGEQAGNEFIWNFVCDMAERLKKNGINGELTMMAYPPYRQIPKRKIPSNVQVMLAESGPWSLPQKFVHAKEQKEIVGWVKKLGHKIWLWNYALKYGHRAMPGIPNLTPKCIGEYYKLEAPYITGAYMQSDTDKYIFNYLNFYVFSKVSWDNNINVDQLLTEHYRVMFGAGAKPMRQVYDALEKNWLRIVGKTVNTLLGPASVPVSTFELWEKIYSKAEVIRLAKLFDEAKRLAAADADAVKRIQFMRDNLLGPIERRRQLFGQNKRELADLTFYAKSIDKPLKIDGVPDNAWEQAELIYLHPIKMKTGTKPAKSMVRCLKGKKKIYFLFECEGPEMRKSSNIELFLNPSGDRKTYYRIVLKPNGNMAGFVCRKRDAGQTDIRKWNSGAKVAVCKGKKLWVAELAIPIKNLPGFAKNGFPINFARYCDKDLYTWSPFLKSGTADLENFGSVSFKQKVEKNFVRNEDFTAKVRGRFCGAWATSPKAKLQKNTAWEIDKATFIKGGKALKLQSQGNSISISQALPGLKPNTDYLLTFFVKTKDVKPSRAKYSGACVNIWNAGNMWFPKNFYIGTMDWAKQGFRFKTKAKNIRGHIILRLMSASGSVWFDDVRIRELK